MNDTENTFTNDDDMPEGVDDPGMGNNPQTVGQQRLAFVNNPSAMPEVDAVKKACARLIDLALETRTRTGAIAATQLETGCMYLVKSLVAR